MNWKGSWRNRLWCILRCYRGICLEGLRKTVANAPAEFRIGDLPNTSYHLSQIALSFRIRAANINVIFLRRIWITVQICGAAVAYIFNRICNKNVMSILKRVQKLKDAKDTQFHAWERTHTTNTYNNFSFMHSQTWFFYVMMTVMTTIKSPFVFQLE
jgi:hypothetical protein